MEDWARILVLAGDQLGFFELQAPWYSNHILRLFYVCLHIYLAGVAIGRSRANPAYQPGPIFFDPCSSDLFHMPLQVNDLSAPQLHLLPIILDTSRGRLCLLQAMCIFPLSLVTAIASVMTATDCDFCF